jgi:ornithine decarboxylase
MNAVARIDQYLAQHKPSTPFVVIDLETVRQRCTALQALLPRAHLYYAVKANPAGAVISALARLGVGFELASTGEIDRCLKLGIASDRFCFGNTIKRESDIVQAHKLGIDLYAVDSPAELEKLARAAPGARVFCRLSVHGRGAEWPLTRKFGCSPQLAVELLIRARRLARDQSALPSMSGLSRPIQRSGRPPLATPRASSTVVTGRALVSIC